MRQGKKPRSLHYPKMHKRVINGDLTAVRVDENNEYCLGSENEVDWPKVLKTFFKKVIGCINARNNGKRQTDIDTEW